MWSNEYHRNLVSPESDYSDFGVPGNTISILDMQVNTKFVRTVIRFPDRHLPEGRVLGAQSDAPIPTYLQECQASFNAGFTDPVAGYMFTPDHAFVIEDQPLAMVSESCWHSHIFYNSYMRCDRSTEWQWRFNDEWNISDVIYEDVNMCYHRFYYQYFHWIMDCLPRIWLFKTFSPSSAAKWAVGPIDMKFHAPALALYDLDPEDCLKFDRDRVVRFKAARIPAFQFIEPLKTRRPDYVSGTWNVGWSAEFLDDLRDRVRVKYRTPTHGDLKLYVSRSDAGHRKLTNEADLLRVLMDHGFTVVAPGEHSFAKQVELFARARVIVGVHGAGLTNLIWAPRNCMVIELAPDGLRDVGYRFSAQLCGHRYAVISCRTFEHPLGLPFSNIEVDVSALMKTVSELA